MQRKAIPGVVASVADGGLLANYDMSDLTFEFMTTGAGKTPSSIYLLGAGANRRQVEPFSRDAPRFLNAREIVALTGLSKATIYRWIRAGKFPEPCMRGPTRWHSNQYLDWSDAKRGKK